MAIINFTNLYNLRHKDILGQTDQILNNIDNESLKQRNNAS